MLKGASGAIETDAGFASPAFSQSRRSQPRADAVERDHARRDRIALRLQGAGHARVQEQVARTRVGDHRRERRGRRGLRQRRYGCAGAQRPEKRQHVFDRIRRADGNRVTGADAIELQAEAMRSTPASRSA